MTMMSMEFHVCTLIDVTHLLPRLNDCLVHDQHLYIDSVSPDNKLSVHADTFLMTPTRSLHICRLGKPNTA